MQQHKHNIHFCFYIDARKSFYHTKRLIRLISKNAPRVPAATPKTVGLTCSPDPENTEHIMVISHINISEEHYLTKSMWTPARRTSHSKIMCINMEYRMSLYVVAFPSLEQKVPRPNHEKQLQTIPHPPNFTVGNMHWGR